MNLTPVQEFVKEMMAWAAEEFEFFNDALAPDDTWVESAAYAFLGKIEMLPEGKTFIETYTELYPRVCIVENGFKMHQEHINEAFITAWSAKLEELDN